MTDESITTCGILCCGPSLAEFLERPVRHDLVIGVNRAACAHPCDVWAFGDDQTFHVFRAKGNPLLLTNRNTDRRLGRRPDFAAHHGWDHRNEAYVDALRTERVVLLEDLNVPLPGRYDETTYTSLVAIAYAIERGARRIRLYGCDLEGTCDWDGKETLGPNRTPSRWRHEAARLSEAAAWARERGILIEGLPRLALTTAFLE